VWANGLPTFTFPYNETLIPGNGIYLLFEKGEVGHGGNRIVRIGTHTGVNQLRSRLRQHFLASNKDRSIFRKNIGRCFLNRDHDLYLAVWELDLTTREAKNMYSTSVDTIKQEALEKEISEYMRKNFFFAVIRVDDKSERMRLESKIISTVSHCKECGPSKNWLGLSSPKDKICESGLWLVNELYKEPLSEKDLQELQKLVI
jgi:hypothetical protein